MFKNFDKNTIIGALLIMTMVMVYFKYSTDQTKKRLEKEKLEAKVQRKNAPNISEVKSLDSSTKTLAVRDTNSQNTTGLAKGEDLVLSNELISLKVNTTGGKIHSVKLARYTTFEEKPVEIWLDKFTEFDLNFSTPHGNLNTSTNLNNMKRFKTKEKRKLELVN